MKKKSWFIKNLLMTLVALSAILCTIDTARQGYLYSILAFLGGLLLGNVAYNADKAEKEKWIGKNKN